MGSFANRNHPIPAGSKSTLKGGVLFALILVLCTALVPDTIEAMANRPREVTDATITDRTGETWDLSQAVNKGFDPEKFQFGLGRNAFTPLDETRLTRPGNVPDELRVIGVEIGGEAQAFSVSVLTRHEIANVSPGGRPVAVAY